MVILGRLTTLIQVKMVILLNLEQLMVLVTGSDQIWSKNLVKIWSRSGCKKSGQNLVEIWFV